MAVRQFFFSFFSRLLEQRDRRFKRNETREDRPLAVSLSLLGSRKRRDSVTEVRDLPTWAVGMGVDMVEERLLQVYTTSTRSLI